MSADITPEITPTEDGWTAQSPHSVRLPQDVPTQDYTTDTEPSDFAAESF